MTSRDFCYWLQGLFELSTVKELDSTQIAVIKKHLNMVFLHEIDPGFGADKDRLLELHNPPASTGTPIRHEQVIINWDEPKDDAWPSLRRPFDPHTPISC